MSPRRATRSVLTVEGDVRDPEVLEALFAQVDEAFGRVDVLINVVGGTSIPN